MSGFAGRYVFVAGLHRTGTSLVASLIGQHPEVAAIVQSPAPENEGCYLQGAIPHTAMHGIPGHYAADRRQHHVEGSRHDTLAVQQRIAADWDSWFEPGGQWRIEKSPVNLTRMRLYQQLFPMAQFVIVLRHPEAMAAALAKWTDQPAAELIEYALAAYELALEDARYLHAVLFVRYEDLAADMAQLMAKADMFLSLDEHQRSATVHNRNKEYLGCQAMNEKQSERALAFGYLPGLDIQKSTLHSHHPLRSIRDQLQ